MNPTEEQTYRNGILDKLTNLQEGIDTIDKKVTYTNGKVRKIIIALVLVSGIVIGQTLTNKEIITAVAQHL